MLRVLVVEVMCVAALTPVPFLALRFVVSVAPMVAPLQVPRSGRRGDLKRSCSGSGGGSSSSSQLTVLPRTIFVVVVVAAAASEWPHGPG